MLFITILEDLEIIPKIAYSEAKFNKQYADAISAVVQTSIFQYIRIMNRNRMLPENWATTTFTLDLEKKGAIEVLVINEYECIV